MRGNFHCDKENGQADCKKDGKGKKTNVKSVGLGQGEEKSQKAGQAQAENRRALAENIVNAEEFARLIRGNELGKIGTRHCLYAALEHTNGNDENPALPLLREKHRKHADSGIGNNCNEKKLFARYLGREFSKNQRARERDELRNEEHNYKLYLVKAQVRTERGCHFDNGMYTVDIEEERHQEKECFLIFLKLAKNRTKTRKRFLNRVCGTRYKVLLFVIFQKRNGEEQPPSRRNQATDGKRVAFKPFKTGHHRTEHVRKQAERERNTAANIPPSVAVCGNVVHSIVRGNIVEHRIVKYVCGRKTHFRNNIHD